MTPLAGWPDDDPATDPATVLTDVHALKVALPTAGLPSSAPRPLARGNATAVARGGHAIDRRIGSLV
jgi:hypothetical protein